MARRRDNFEELAGVFLAMSDKTRLAILLLLAKKEMHVAALQEKLQLSQANASHHLSLLYRAGLVVSRRDGRRTGYSIADLAEHRLGRKSKSTAPGSNAARFGPTELVLPRTAAQSDKLEEIEVVFQALRNETRLRIVALLGKGEQQVTAICDKLQLPLSGVSYHLCLLRLGGLVVNRREHKKVFYSLADLSKHRLGRKPKTTLPDVNAAKFGPAELVLLEE